MLFVLLSYESDAERVLDTLAFGMGFFELLRRTFEVRPHVLQLCRHFLLQRQLLHLDSVIGVRGHSRVGVLLPGVGLRPADDDLEAVVLDSAGEGLAQTTFGDEGLDGFLYLRTERFEGFFGLVACYLCCKKLINNFIIVLCALRLIVVSIHCFNDYVNRATPFSMAIALRIAA